MTAPTASTVVEFGFGFGALVDLTDGQWTAVTASTVADISSDRGRLSELDSISAGTCTITLEDPNSRLFDPLNTAGTHYGKLLPGVQVRVRALVGVTYYPVFRGHVVAWKQSAAKQLGVVTANCVDATRLLANARLDQSVYATTVLADSPHLYWRLGEATGEVASDSSGNSNDGVYTGAGQERGAASIVPSGDGALKILQTVTLAGVMPGVSAVRSSSAAARITTEPYSFECWIHAPEPLPLPSGGAGASTTLTLWMQGDPTTAASRFWVIYKHVVALDGVTITTQVRAGNASASTSWTPANRLDDGLPHHVVVTSTGGVQALYVDGATIPVGFTSTETIPASDPYAWIGAPDAFTTWVGLIDEVAWYDVALSSTQVANHYSSALTPWDGDNTGTRIGRVLDLIGWPAGLRAIDTGETVLGPAVIAGRTAWDYMQSIAATENGRSFIDASGKVTFHQADRFLTNSSETSTQCVFSDDEAGDSVYAALTFSLDDTFVYNEAQVTRDGGIPQSAEDTSSSATYGPRTRSLTGLLYRTDAQSRNRAEQVVFRYPDPQTRASTWSAQPDLDSVDWPTILNLELGDRVTVEAKPQNVGTQIALDLHIEKVAHQISGASWIVTFAGSPVDPSVYFTWGGVDATQGWGTTGVWR